MLEKTALGVHDFGEDAGAANVVGALHSIAESYFQYPAVGGSMVFSGVLRRLSVWGKGLRDFYRNCDLVSEFRVLGFILRTTFQAGD